ncbi:MAG: aldo/keto reductase [Clostridia bacterium]|nr:aldo/keto reductase [Clostridia bacterium]
MKYSDCFGKKSSRIVLGTAYFGDGIAEVDAFLMMDSFCALGGTHIDTARLYADGKAEEIVGRWRKSRKADNILISSKGAYYDPNMGERPRLSESDVRQDLEKSLRALDTECIDFYWLHRDDETKPVGEIIELLNKLVIEGKIKKFGASNWRAKRISEANVYAQKAGLMGFSASQIRFNPAASCGDERLGLVNMDEAEFAFYKQRNMPVVAYSSQAKGFFSKMAELGESALSEKARKRYLTEENLIRLEIMKKLSQKYGTSVAAIICGAFCSFCEPEVFPVIGGSNVHQIEDSMGGANVTIEKRELEDMFQMKL